MEFEVGVRLLRIEEKVDYLIEELQKAQKKAKKGGGKKDDMGGSKSGLEAN